MDKDLIIKDLDGCSEIINVSEKLLKTDFKNKNQIEDLSLELTELKSDLQDQEAKINKEVYEIAVVGREKAGKSSLLNAWIKFDLLPAQRKRCTYTTTELRSCSTNDEQKYEIEYFSKQEFENKLDNTKDGLNNLLAGRDRELLQQEMDEIEELYDEIQNYLGKGRVEKKFKSFDEVRNELKSAISSPGQARAIKKVCIWTPIINSDDKIVLYDVPGYDSPITLHKEQTKNRIASVDAILYAKEFKSPDLVDSEIEILKISDSSNPYIKAKDKIIVALTCCDLVNSPREYNELVTQHQNGWKNFGVIPSRVVPVCSLAELSPDSVDGENVMARLKLLNNGESGMKQLKNAVKSCVDDSRNRIAQERCDELKNKIKEFSGRLNQLIKTDFNIDVKSEVKETLDESEMDKIYFEWWAEQWRHIHEDFQTFFQSEIRPKANADAPAYLSVDAVKLKKSYEDIIDRTFKGIPSTKKERQNAIYIGCIGNDGVVNPIDGNQTIRLELSRDAINSIDRITHELTVYLWKNISKIISWINNKLYNMPEIRQEMIGFDEHVEDLLMRKAFDSLIQRLARPATDIFLTYPRMKLIRLRVLREYQMELMILDNFVENGKMKSRGIIPFIANGKHGKFQFDGAYTERLIMPKQNDEKVKVKVTNKEQQKDSQSDNSIKLAETEKKDLDSDSKKESKLRTLFAKRADKKNETPEVTQPQERQSIFHRHRQRAVKTNDNSQNYVNPDEDIISNDSTEDIIEVIEFPKNAAEIDDSDNFEKLTFSPESSNVEQVFAEIDGDLNEFISCMKNSVFYGSGIQRFFNQELDKYRRKFIELEEEKHRWFFLISKYIKLNDSKIKIPAPKMADEVAQRRELVLGTRKINEILSDF